MSLPSSRKGSMGLMEASMRDIGYREFTGLEDEGSCSIYSGRKDEEGDGEAEKRFASRETRVISILRILLFVSMVTIGIVLSISTYRLASQDDGENSMSAVTFKEVATVAVESFPAKVASKISDLDAFASDLMIYAESQGTTWPEVTIEGYELLASKLRFSNSAHSIMVLPLVDESELTAWQNYSRKNINWVNNSLGYYRDENGFDMTTRVTGDFDSNVHDLHKNGSDIGVGPYLPLWQTSPPLANLSSYNLNMLTTDEVGETLQRVISTGQAVIGRSILHESSTGPWQLGSESTFGGRNIALEPHGVIAYPIFQSYYPKEDLKAILLVTLPWSFVLAEVLPAHMSAVCLLGNTDGQSFTYVVSESSLEYVGKGDHRTETSKESYVELEWTTVLHSTIAEGRPDMSSVDADYLRQFITLVPSNEQGYMSTETNSIFYASMVALVFAFVILLFALYDWLVRTRQKKILSVAVRSDKLVASLFPAQVRDRLLQASSFHDDASDRGDRGDSESPFEDTESSDSSPNAKVGEDNTKDPPKRRLRHFLRDSTGSTMDVTKAEEKPIADLFPHCTVLFADIAGFTAWSSEREPTQVFTLLQKVYMSFDKAARKRGVFKVETIGDSYVAVTGLPDPQADHALRMAGFAVECRTRMKEVTRKLERTLGPETGDLCMRFGLHSGPVTAGVLQGERSRFQLFGDTVNTAARMESTGQRNCIQLSETTATLLTEAGKGHWVSPRDEPVSAKGKGLMKTFWLNTREASSRRLTRGDSGRSGYFDDARSVLTYSTDEMEDTPEDPEPSEENPRGMLKAQKKMIWANSEVLDEMTPTLRRSSSDSINRLVDWNVDVLIRLLKKVIAKRLSQSGRLLVSNEDFESNQASSVPIDEVTEIIALPSFDAESAKDQIDPNAIELDEEVVCQLRDFVIGIASMYRDNPFHNYEHACHVQMSMVKLLQRVVSPDHIDYDNGSEAAASKAHEYTHGITSDPLTQFAVVFCALIHDVDHTGVANGQLVKENAPVATHYSNKSVAEQNSIDLAWDLLMDDKFEDFRRCIFVNESEFKRFRQIVVNVVLATDIFDKELSELRKARWTKAFSPEAKEEAPIESAIIQGNRKATIIIELFIQASDVSHTMQHWDIYRKWNEKLFFEMFSAYKSGRTTSDPSEGWYKGEIWFFDNYVIPLAKKLKDTGVFGVSSDECFNYATENRRLWADRGEQIVQDMIAVDYFGRLKEEAKEKRSRRRMIKNQSLG